jgi:ATP-dependent Lon protease
MTGELSANGEMCKIGGVQSKLTSAHSINVNTFLLPYSNMADVLECPQELLKDITVYFIRDYNQIYSFLFHNQKNKNDLVCLKNGSFGKKQFYTSMYQVAQVQESEIIV